MTWLCPRPCGNKTADGYCGTTACINPKYSNFGTAQYGQGVQKRIITNADRIRAMTDEELAEFVIGVLCYTKLPYMEVREKALRDNELLDWMKEASE